MKEIKKVAVIGGGAAGFFAALSVAEHHPSAHITLYEKSSKVLSKVKISGGGRCNVTHNCTDINTLIQAYPRGGKQLKSIFHAFQPKDTIAWFNARGVALKTEKDGRMFPITDDSQTIIDCLETACNKLGIQRQLNSGVEKISPQGEQWLLEFKNGSIQCDAVIVTTGGSPKEKGFDWLANIEHSIIPPVPSLFTFNMPKEDITQLMGVVAKKNQSVYQWKQDQNRRAYINYPLGNEWSCNFKSFIYGRACIGKSQLSIQHKSAMARRIPARIIQHARKNSKE